MTTHKKALAFLKKDWLCALAVLVALLGFFEHSASDLVNIIRAIKGLPPIESTARAEEPKK